MFEALFDFLINFTYHKNFYKLHDLEAENVIFSLFVCTSKLKDKEKIHTCDLTKNRVLRVVVKYEIAKKVITRRRKRVTLVE